MADNNESLMHQQSMTMPNSAASPFHQNSFQQQQQQQATAPINIGRMVLPVNYLTSISVATAQTAAHVFVVSENEGRLPPGKKPQKRLALIADRSTFQSDLDLAISRCVMFSQVTEMSVVEDHLAPLTGPLSEYDALVQQSLVHDFIRTFSAVFKPNSTANLPVYAVEEGQILTHRVHARLAPNAFQDVVGTAAQETALRQLRAQKDREIQVLQEALQKQKDQSLLEMVDLHTQNESLKHALSQNEQCLLATRRAAKEEKDLLVARLRQFEAERDIRTGRSPIGVEPHASSINNLTGNQNDYQPPPPVNAYTDGSNRDGYGVRPMAHNTPAAAIGVPGSTNPMAGGYRMTPGAGGAASPTPFATASRPTQPSYYAPTTPQQRQPSPNTTAGYVSGGGGGYSSSGGGASGRSPNAALDQLQAQLSDGERFLQDMQKKQASRYPH